MSSMQQAQPGGSTTYSRSEWISVLRSAKPGLSEEEYAAAWDRFHRAKVRELLEVNGGVQQQ